MNPLPGANLSSGAGECFREQICTRLQTQAVFTRSTKTCLAFARNGEFLPRSVKQAKFTGRKLPAYGLT
jgi:hypothetical protein